MKIFLVIYILISLYYVSKLVRLEEFQPLKEQFNNFCLWQKIFAAAILILMIPVKIVATVLSRT